MNSFSKRDQQIIWHPFTQEKTASDVIAIKYAKGSYLYDEQNKPYLDLISSWWVNLHGHAHPKIAKAIYNQAKKLEHVIFAGFTHTPAVELCENLQQILPNNLKRFFFSDNGSSSVEVALKMAYQYWQNCGKLDKTIFLSFEGGYHGDTFGAMSVGKKSGFHQAFNKLLFDVLTLPYPETWEDDDMVEAKEIVALACLDDYLNTHGNKIAALIVEPLIQGASGMRICRPAFLQTLIEKVREHGILVIFDEVMTGFGRTGHYFAMDYLEIIPDFICLAKGLTGGFLPLALTVTTDEIYKKFLSDEWKHAFAHGHSYTANPLACSAAIASFKLLQRQSTQKAIKNINQAHLEGAQHLKELCHNITHIRVLGTILAFDVKSDRSDLNHQLKSLFLAAGLLIRPLGKTVYLLPPYCITAKELLSTYQKIVRIIKQIC